MAIKKAAPDQTASNNAISGKKQKNWTVMVYLAGDNNLSEEMVFALKSMFTVGSPSKDTRIVALYDSIGSFVPFDIPVAHKTPMGTPAACLADDHRLKEHQDKFLHDRKTHFVDKNGTPLDRKTEAFQQVESLFSVKVGAFTKLANLKNIPVPVKPGSRPNPSKPAFALGQKDLNAFKSSLETMQKSLKNVETVLVKQQDDEEKEKPDLRRFRLDGSVDDILERFMIDVIKTDVANNDTDRNYALILSGHGSGAVGDFLTSGKQFFGLTIQGLSAALKIVGARLGKSGKWLDILGFDSCLMGMAEVGYEVRNSVRFMVGSEGYQPNTGWPYDQILAILHKNETINPREFASQIVDEHIKYYNDYTAGDLSVDLSAMDLSRLAALVKAVGASKVRKKEKLGHGLAVLLAGWFHHLEENSEPDEIRDAVVLAHWEAQGYKDEQYADLGDFCACLRIRTDQIKERQTLTGKFAAKTPEQIEEKRRRILTGKFAAKISEACDEIVKLIESSTLVFRSSYCGSAFQYSRGVSIFFPWADLKDAAGVSEVVHYSGLDFAHDTHWDEFLLRYFEKTKRKERTDVGAHPRRSFLNYRPWLFTGVPKKPGSRTAGVNFRTAGVNFRTAGVNFRTAGVNFRTAGVNFRSAGVNFRTAGVNFRTAGVNFRTAGVNFRNSGSGNPSRISSMKNPPIDWYELKKNKP